jgi:hypothetical protein
MGTYDGEAMSALGINNDGVVVGHVSSRAFRWDATAGYRDLNDLIPVGSGWVLLNATGINDEGKIAGDGLLDGRIRGFLLELEPSAAQVASISRLDLSRYFIVGATDAQGRVKADVELSRPAPAGGVDILVSLSNAEIVTAPTLVHVGEGERRATFVVQTAAVPEDAAVTVTVTLGPSSASASLSIASLAPVSLLLGPARICGGGTSAATLVLNGLAPDSGLVVQVQSTSAAAHVPATFVVPKGQSRGTAAIATDAVIAASTADISMTANGRLLSARLTLLPAALLGICTSAYEVAQGQSLTITLYLTGDAPVGGFDVTLTTSLPGSLSLPSTVRVPAGARKTSISASPHAVASRISATITAHHGSDSRSAKVVLVPA